MKDIVRIVSILRPNNSPKRWAVRWKCNIHGQGITYVEGAERAIDVEQVFEGGQHHCPGNFNCGGWHIEEVIEIDREEIYFQNTDKAREHQREKREFMKKENYWGVPPEYICKKCKKHIFGASVSHKCPECGGELELIAI